MRSDPPDVPRQRFSLTESEVDTLNAALDSYLHTIITNGLGATGTGKEAINDIVLVKHRLNWRQSDGS